MQHMVALIWHNKNGLPFKVVYNIIYNLKNCLKATTSTRFRPYLDYVKPMIDVLFNIVVVWQSVLFNIVV